MSFISIRQEFQGRGARFEQLRGLVNTQLVPEVDGLKTEQDNMGDQYSNDTGNSAVRLHETQEDLKGMLRTLAQQVENLQGGTHPESSQPENAASIVMDVEDLKSKATRLIEQVDQHNRHLNTLALWLERIQFQDVQKMTTVGCGNSGMRLMISKLKWIYCDQDLRCTPGRLCLTEWHLI